METFEILILSLILLIAYIVWSSYRTTNYWEEKGIVNVKPLPLFGSVLESLKKPLHESLLENHKKYGDVYGYYEGSTKVLSVADPKLLRKILVKDFHLFTDRRTLKTGDKITERMIQLLEGDDWRRVRTIISPTFTTGKIKRMMDIFKSCSKVLINNFKEAAHVGDTVNAKFFYSAFSLDVIANAAFSTKIDSHNNPNNDFVKKARETTQNKLNFRFIFYLLFPRVMRFFKVPIFPPEIVKFFSEVTLKVIEERKRTGVKGNDFLQLLMDTAEESRDEIEELAKKDDVLRHYEEGTNSEYPTPLKNSNFEKKLSFDELVAQCVIFFLAGFETTASTLAFATYHLALNSDVQEKLLEEIEKTVKSYEGKLTYEGIQSMKYLDNVISETLRITPPAIRLERIAGVDYELDGTGIKVPKGTLITIPIIALHKDAKYFPDPEKFDPDRFNPEIKELRDSFAFLPFGAGPRNCVGMRFALIEIKVCLAYLISHFKIKRCSETKVPLEFKLGHGLLHPKEIIVKFEKRDNLILVD